MNLRVLGVVCAVLCVVCQGMIEASAVSVAQKVSIAGAVDPARQQPTIQRPGLHAKTLGGEVYDLAAHRGKWVLVNVWATWCEPCLKEMPELSALHRRRRDVEVVGLAYDDSKPEEIRTFLRSHPVVYPIILVDVSNPPKNFAAPRGLPMSYLIAPDGTVAKQFLGSITARDVEGVIGAVGKAR
ncbi:TlpA family protein disulfide reductase [Xylella fastidiosa]|uniref:TlpA family protein disulfide reductase n=1 Tax=Xylella fastidiosa TaxID=2371 RepID=A0ABC8ACY8_XYLFS|nr:TlpA disulfide reductase family protein [Xylella fastidiosa]ALR04029.1 TlpA family protein disulfide reductase [Xylella fastidiosa]ALR06374.1 TlpA family protein disulfide reductase [Xylella fastidiosa]ARO68432.1 thioredoxin [Xylella fastidiosa subsp. pauca]AVI20560.1 thioredoxin [Xylella fastidiosa]AVI22578.1 thioredoxin [Xylella fastidiosa]